MHISNMRGLVFEFMAEILGSGVKILRFARNVCPQYTHAARHMRESGHAQHRNPFWDIPHSSYQRFCRVAVNVAKDWIISRIAGNHGGEKSLNEFGMFGWLSRNVAEEKEKALRVKSTWAPDPELHVAIVRRFFTWRELKNLSLKLGATLYRL